MVAVRSRKLCSDGGTLFRLICLAWFESQGEVKKVDVWFLYQQAMLYVDDDGGRELFLDPWLFGDYSSGELDYNNKVYT